MPAERQIGDYLKDDDALLALRAEYQPHRAELVAQMGDHLPRRYQRARGFVDAIEEAFYENLPSDLVARDRKALSLQDRERIIIALLTSREERLLLAIHLYIALMEGVAPEELAHIIFLSGIYTGVSGFTQGIGVLETTLGLLEELGRAPDAVRRHPLAVLGALQAKLGS